MNEIEDKFLQHLEDEADKWVEEELARRMVTVKEAIQEQVNISLPEIGPARGGNHLKNALAYAEEEVRRELEFEAQARIDEEMKRRRAAMGSDSR